MKDVHNSKTLNVQNAQLAIISNKMEDVKRLILNVATSMLLANNVAYATPGMFLITETVL